MMGPMGLIMAICGGGVLVVAQVGISRVESQLEPARRSGSRILWSVLPMAFALFVYFDARKMGFGRAGILICVAILMANAAAVAYWRSRVFALAATGPAQRRHQRAFVLLEMAGAWLLFAGCAVYLLRP